MKFFGFSILINYLRIIIVFKNHVILPIWHLVKHGCLDLSSMKKMDYLNLNPLSSFRKIIIIYRVN